MEGDDDVVDGGLEARRQRVVVEVRVGVLQRDADAGARPRGGGADGVLAEDVVENEVGGAVGGGVEGGAGAGRADEALRVEGDGGGAIDGFGDQVEIRETESAQIEFIFLS